MIESFDKNVEVRELDKLPVKSDVKNNDKMKDAFSLLLASAQGGGIRTNSPIRKYRKRIWSLKTHSQDKSQSLLDEWIGIRKMDKK